MNKFTAIASLCLLVACASPTDWRNHYQGICLDKGYKLGTKNMEACIKGKPDGPNVRRSSSRSYTPFSDAHKRTQQNSSPRTSTVYHNTRNAVIGSDGSMCIKTRNGAICQ